MRQGVSRAGSGLRNRVQAACLVLLLALPAAAAPYVLDGDASRIEFSYLENATPTRGSFDALSGTAAFDPADPAAATMVLTVAATGIDLGDPVRSYFAQSIDWFDAERYPSFTVHLDQLVTLAPGRFRAVAVVRIKGREVTITPEISVAPEGPGLRATGSLRLNRHDFGLGIGFSALFATIGQDVDVTFDLLGRPAP